MREVGKIYTIVVVDDFKHKRIDLDDDGTLDMSHGEAVEASIYKRAKELKIPLSQIRIERKQVLLKDPLRPLDKYTTEKIIANEPLQNPDTYKIFEEIIADIKNRKQEYFAVNLSFGSPVGHSQCNNVKPENVAQTWKKCSVFLDELNKNKLNYVLLDVMAKDWVPTYVSSGNDPDAYKATGILASSTITVGPSEDKNNFQVNNSIDKWASPYVEYTTTEYGLDLDKDGITDYVLDQFKVKIPYRNNEEQLKAEKTRNPLDPLQPFKQEPIKKESKPTFLTKGKTGFLQGTSFAAPQAIINDVAADMKKQAKSKVAPKK